MDAKAWCLPLGSQILDLSVGELFDAEGKPAQLRRQALQLLLVLGERPAQVVGKDELMSRVWPHVVVGEGSLTQAIADVRRALGDSDHRLVRNVARRGYLLQPSPDFGSAAAASDAVSLAADEVPLLALAVLPFAVEGPTGDDAWFAAALHGDLITDLTRILRGHVIARGTTIGYDGASVDPRRVARELQVRHVARGSLRREADQVRLNLALVDGGSGVQQWADMFVLQRTELASGLADLALLLARQLQREMVFATVKRRAALTPLQVTADDLAMRASAAFQRGLTQENLREANGLAERAVALDVNCVRGWNDLVTSNLQLLLNGWRNDREAVLALVSQAVEHVERADFDGQIHFQARVIQAFLRQDLPAMVRITTDFVQRHRHPTNFGTHGYALLFNGRADEAVAALQTALRLSPRDAMRAEWQYRLAAAHFMAGRDELANDWAQTAALSNPCLEWPPLHAAAMAALGEHDAAREAFAAHLARHPGFAATGRQLIARRLPGHDATLVRTRERLIDLLVSLGMD